MPSQQIMAGLLVAAAGAYMILGLRRKKDQPRSKGPDVPVSRLTRKRRRRD